MPGWAPVGCNRIDPAVRPLNQGFGPLSRLSAGCLWERRDDVETPETPETHERLRESAVPERHLKFEISTDGGATFDHPTAVDATYGSAHYDESLVTGQGQPVRLPESEDSNRDDEYGVFSVSVACE